tara:strand:- start:320 stop:1210 length:891 start_codon:yes stop_codon:yes gene_type:complete
MKERDQLMQILMEQGAGKSMKETEFDALLATKQGHELVEHLRLIDQAVKYKKARRRTLSRINIDPNELRKEMVEEENGEQEDAENESSSLLLLQKKARMLLFKIPKGKKKRKGGKGKGKGGSGKVIEKEDDTNQKGNASAMFSRFRKLQKISRKRPPPAPPQPEHKNKETIIITTSKQEENKEEVKQTKMEKTETKQSDPVPADVTLSNEQIIKNYLGADKGIDVTKKRFKLMDRKKTGFVSVEKLKKILKRQKVMDDDELEMMLEMMMDDDGDGLISLEEFLIWVHGEGAGSNNR